MLKKFSGLVRTILYGKQYPFNAKSVILGDEEFLLREIIDQVEIDPKRRGETLSLEVRLSNTDAQRLYRRLGFSARNIRKNYYTENNEDALDMIKRLEVG